MGDSSFKQLRPLSKAISQEKALQFISYLSKIIIIIISPFFSDHKHFSH